MKNCDKQEGKLVPTEVIILNLYEEAAKELISEG